MNNFLRNNTKTNRGLKIFLRDKIEKWLDSIDDPAIKIIASRSVILTGGAIVDLLRNKTPKDYDLFFKDRNAF